MNTNYFCEMNIKNIMFHNFSLFYYNFNVIITKKLKKTMRSQYKKKAQWFFVLF